MNEVLPIMGAMCPLFGFRHVPPDVVRNKESMPRGDAETQGANSGVKDPQPQLQRHEAASSVTRCVLLVVAVMLLASPVWATVYYVSRSDGNDNYNGTAQLRTTGSTGPWNTIAKVNASSFVPGDSILFKRGEVWRERLIVPSSGSPGNPITFGAYGSGSRPTVNGSDILTGWAAISSDVYRATVATQPYAVWFDGSVGTRKPSIGTLSADRDWHWSSNQLYIYSSTGPSARTIESSSRQTVFMSDKSWITLEQLTFAKGGNAARDDKSIAIRQSAHIVLQDCDVTDSVNIGVDIFGVDGISGDATIQRCAFERTGLSKDQLGAHSAVQTYNTTENPTFIVQHNTFQDIDLYGAHHGHGIYALSGRVIWRFNYHKGDSGPVRAGAAVRLANTGGSQVYYNVFSNEGGKRYWGVLATAGIHYVYNNVFYQNNYGLVADTGSPTVVAQNNIFAGSFDETWYYMFIQAGTYRGDNNLFFGGGNGWRYKGVTKASLVEWRTLSGQDGRSLNADPLFLSTFDFRLQESSPAIDAGVDVGVTADFLGTHVPQGHAPDIGAYEKSPGEDPLAPRAPTGLVVIPE